MPYALCPMPYALCPMPYALCPMPLGQIVPYVNEKHYTYSVSASRTLQPSFPTLYCRDRFFRNFVNNQITFSNMDTKSSLAMPIPNPQTPKIPSVKLHRMEDR